MSWVRERWRRFPRTGLVVGGLCLALSAWLQPSFGELHSPNPLVRIYLTRALVDDGAVAIDGPVRRYGDLSDKSRREGHIYCDKAPGVSLLAVPIYGAMRLFAPVEQISNRLLLSISRLLLCALPAVLCAVLIDLWLLALGVAARRRLAALCALGAGSLLLPYSLELFGHLPAAALVTVTAFLALGPRGGPDGWALSPDVRPLRALLAGLCAGLAVMTEYPTLFLVAWILLAALIRDPRRVRFALFVALGGLGPAVVLGLYHDLAFGGPLVTGYAFIDNPFFRDIHAQGFMGLAAPRAEAFFASFLSPARGVCFAAPWLLAAPVGAILLWRRHRATAVTLLGVAATDALFVSSFRYWIGGWALGQRHLTPVMPLAALAFGVALEAAFRSEGRIARTSRIVLAALAAIAVVQITAACLTMPTFAEEFQNPFYELTLRLWRGGLFPHSIGTWAGLGSRTAAVVPATIALLLVLLCLRGGAHPGLPAIVDGTRRAVAAIGVGCWISLAAVLGQGNEKSQHRFEWIVDTVWEPRDALPPKLPDPVKTLSLLRRPAPPDPTMLRHLGRHLAAQGDNRGALELFARAALQEMDRP